MYSKSHLPSLQSPRVRPSATAVFSEVSRGRSRHATGRTLRRDMVSCVHGQKQPSRSAGAAGTHSAAMAARHGSVSDSEGRSAAAEPQVPNWNIKKLSRTFSQETSTSTATWYSGTGTLLKASLHEEDPPAHYETHLCTVGFVLKIVEWTICILCTGLFFEGSALIYDFKKQLFPYIAYWTYMMITGVIILSYLLGQKMREMLIRIYNIIGALMFFTAAIIISSNTAENWEKWNHVHLNKNIPTTTEMPTKTHSPSTSKLAMMLLIQSLLCFINSFVYFFDTGYSLYSSYKTVRLDIQVKST